MKLTNSIKKNFLPHTKAQDLVVIFGLLLFATVLVIGLFPKTDATEETGQLFFFNILMSVPLIIAVYFIIISFRHKITKDRSEVDVSIRAKIAMAFLFVAILPSLPIVLISNNVINRTIAELFSGDTYDVLDRAIKISEKEIVEISHNMRNDISWLKYSIDNNILDVHSVQSRQHITNILRQKGLVFKCYFVENQSIEGNTLLHVPGDAGNLHYADGVAEYLSLIDIPKSIFISKISVAASSLLIGGYYRAPYLVAIYRVVPEEFKYRSQLFIKAKNDFEKKILLRPHLQSIVGLLLLILSFCIVFFSVAISLVLSKSITRPVLELADGAKRVASGDFSIRLYRYASDELTLLYNSFNKMVRQLEESRKAMFQMEKLKAWREVGTRMLHEIKNPLTPIRLSAERMRKRFLEKHENISDIILNGTETIIEEVEALQHILGEFGKFARLPGINPIRQDLNTVVKNCVNFYHGHENVTFELQLADNLPEVCFDRLLLRQAFINIIKNAVEAIGEKGLITLETRLQNATTAEIRIKDNGPGIAEHDLQKIFEPSFSRKEQGSGLGLAIVEKIILDHKGKIYCQSKQGKGTLFVIQLPIEQDVED